MKKILTVLTVILAVFNLSEVSAFADGSVYASKSQNALSVSADKYAIIETDTKTFLAGSGSYETFAASHFTKLMTLLLVSEKIDDKSVSLDDVVSVSEYANSQQGSQVWLDKGEKITVLELVKAVTVGNANDACVALSETVDKKISGFVSKMNDRAKKLGMINTVYVDCTGESNDNVTTVHDTAILASELLSHEYLQEYLTTWRDYIGEKKSEVVNQNTLVKSYKGITGLKACVSAQGVNMISASAKRGDMSIVCVAVGCASKDARASDAENLLDYAFEGFFVYTPKIDEKLLDDIKVVHGDEKSVGVSLSKPLRLVVKRGTESALEVESSREESVEAPRKKGEKIGNITVKNGEKTIFSSDIELSADAEKVTVLKAFFKLIYSLAGKI